MQICWDWLQSEAHSQPHQWVVSHLCQRTPSSAGNRDAGAGAECSLNIPKHSSDSHRRRREGEERHLFKNSKYPSLVMWLRYSLGTGSATVNKDSAFMELTLCWGGGQSTNEIHRVDPWTTGAWTAGPQIHSYPPAVNTTVLHSLGLVESMSQNHWCREPTISYR